MAESLKVNANSSVLEHKRKHNLLVDGLPEIIEEKMEQGETMSGYNVGVPTTDENREVNNIYVGVCKNGNKITFVIFGSFTKLLTGNNSVSYGFDIPSNVGAKLYPYEIGGGYYLDNRTIQGTQRSDWGRKTLNLDVIKTNDTHLYFAIYIDGAVLNEETYFRVEQTFLLSDNLIPQTQGE